MGIATKKAFAADLGVTPGRLSQYLAAGQIHGSAIVGTGHRARIDVDVAKGQLRRNLDCSQSTGQNARAKVNGQKPCKDGREAEAAATIPVDVAGDSPAPPDAFEDTLEDRIKVARLAQLNLSNQKASDAARARSGVYMETASARQEIGRVSIKFIGLFEAALPEFADALSVKVQLPSREILDAMRETWRRIRVREASRERLAAKNDEGSH